MVQLCAWQFIVGTSKQHCGSTLTVVPLYVIRRQQRYVTGRRDLMPTSHCGRGSYRHSDSSTSGRTAATGRQRLPTAKAIWIGCGTHFIVYSDKPRVVMRVNSQLRTLPFSSRTKSNPCTCLPHLHHCTTFQERQLHQWTTVTSDEIVNLIGSALNKCWELDPAPTWLVKDLWALVAVHLIAVQ